MTVVYNKHSEFCFPEIINEVEVKQNSLFSEGPVIKCFARPPNSKVEKQIPKNCLLDASWNTNLPRFPRARPDHVLPRK